MTTAREQATEAVRLALNPQRAAWMHREAAAAASDVWEPLLKEAIEWIEGLDLGLDWDGQDRILERLKAAIGDA